MKKFMILTSVLFLLTGLAGCDNGTSDSLESSENEKQEEIEFDADNIIFKAPLISDAHIGYQDKTVNNEERLDYVFKTYKELKGNDYDAILSCGDQTQNGTAENVSAFMNVYNNNFSLADTPLIFCHGNHDTYWSGCMGTVDFYNAYGKDVYSLDIGDEEQTEAKLGNRHVCINGVHIVCVNVAKYMPNDNVFTEHTKEWLETTLNSIVSENPNFPILVLSHCPAKNTIWGSTSLDDSGDWGASEELNDMLKDYPQVILFSGHTHFGCTDERAIVQTNFTSVGVPSCCDLDLDTYMENVSELANRRSYSFGEYVEVDKYGNTRITRYDLIKKQTIKSPWIISAPKDDKSHLVKYSLDERTKNNVSPSFKEDATFEVYKNENNKICFKFDAASDDDMILKYNIYGFVLDCEDWEQDSIWVSSYMDDWYNYPNQKDGKVIIETSYKWSDNYFFGLEAVDSFGATTRVYVNKKEN